MKWRQTREAIQQMEQHVLHECVQCEHPEYFVFTNPL